MWCNLDAMRPLPCGGLRGGYIKIDFGKKEGEPIRWFPLLFPTTYNSCLIYLSLLDPTQKFRHYLIQL